MQVKLGSTNKYVPFQVLRNGGDFTPLPGQKPVVHLEKDGRAPVPAQGAIIDNGTGTYWLTPNANDRDTLGMVVLLVTAPSGDLAPSAAFEVVAFDPDSPPSPTNLTINSGLSPADSNNLRLLTTYSIPQADRALVQ